ncbi:transporter substrate-binding domain-containing protein [Siccirubricoccus deserti]
MVEPKHLRAALAGIVGLIGLAFPAAAADPDPLGTIRQRGSIAIGVKADYPLFGQLGADGRPEGMEIDLARDLARRLGVEARLVVVTSANRLQRLEDGTVDLVIATLGDTEQRREIVTMIEPNYYASGVNLMVPPDSRLHDWSELRGQKVCATQGAYFNRQLAERYLVDLQLFGNNRDARLAVRAGRCVGWAYDDTAIASDLATPEWAGWRMPLRSALVTPWALALPAPRATASCAARWRMSSPPGTAMARCCGQSAAGTSRRATSCAAPTRFGTRPTARASRCVAVVPMAAGRMIAATARC